jgi:maleylpyruvate isomerase
MIELYSFFRSSAAYRVRIALNLKGIDPKTHAVHLRRGGGEQFAEAYSAINPQAAVPTIVEDGMVLSQSLAIIEYLDETRPQPPLLPADPATRAQARAIALAIACDIHPLNNLRVLKRLADMGVSEADRDAWYRHWVEIGLSAVDEMVRRFDCADTFIHGTDPGLADICLVPQLYNARRFSADLGTCARLLEIERRCLELPAFAMAAPERQPDAED